MNRVISNEENKDFYINKLEQNCKSLEAENQLLKNQLTWMMEQVKLNKHKKFGASSEKSEYDQISLFNEAEAEAKASAKEPVIEEINYKRRKKVGKKNKMLSDLPVETIEYFLPDLNNECAKCGNTLHIMGKNIRKELKIIPAEIKVIEHVQNIYSCRNCEKNDIETPIVKAKLPNQIIKGSIASPSVVSYIMSQKYVNAMPLYRQEKEFERLGIDISRQNMANWVIKCSNQWLEPLYNILKEKLLIQDILHADETVVQVLKEKNKKPQSNSYMWLYRTGSTTNQHIVLYEYKPDRSKERPLTFLKDFKGYLHADGYEVYHKLSNNIIVCGCLAHARRKFDEALKSIDKAHQIGSYALVGKTYCDKLFAIERKLANEIPKVKYELRLELSKPILDEFLVWLKSVNALPKSALGKAISYTLNQWKYLNNYLLDGRCEISNNRAERSIKSFVIGRKNFLFCDTPRGAKASSIIYSIVETAKENNLKPMEYLNFLLAVMPNIDFKNDQNQLEKLLPWSNLPEECYLKKNN